MPAARYPRKGPSHPHLLQDVEIGAAPLSAWREAATLARLQAEIEAQAAVIRHQADALARSRKLFDRASAAARIGVWECDLMDDALTWTDQVFDLFDMASGTAPDRDRTLDCYTPVSRAQLEEARSRAIAARTGFQLDAEIVTPKGNHRWIRLTATVECEDGVPRRIFGMKQDITEEKLLSVRLRHLAEFDTMTGLANRSTFQTRLAAQAEDHPAAPHCGALLLVDLDGFKQINDVFGHAIGDECLKEAASRLKTVCRDAELVARIGGDEFAVLLQACRDQSVAAGLAQRIVDALGVPMQRNNRLLQIGASVGIAVVPGAQEAIGPDDLFTRADAALYAAKAAGRNTFRFFSPEMMVLDQADDPPAHWSTARMTKAERRRFRRATVA